MTDLVVTSQDDLPASLRRQPIYDLLMSSEAGKRQVELITAQAAKGANPGELAQFLELCATYGLDPMAKEAWCVVSTSGNNRNVMITVGRDGLRKIAARQGFRLRGDAVHADDLLQIETNDDGTHNVKHSYGLPAARGELVGSWCRVEDPNGVERGFHFAPLGEYRPANPNKWTPWHNQPSVMIRAASERQALSQATPLSGLVAVGEMDLGESQGLVNGAPGGVIEGPADPAQIAADFARETTEVVSSPQEADVVDTPPVELEATLSNLLDEKVAAESEGADTGTLNEEIAAVEAQLAAAANPDQETLL